MYNMAKYKIGKFLGMVAVLGLVSCSMAKPSNFTENKPRVYTENYVVEAPAVAFGEKELDMLAADFSYHGSGIPEVTVTYDPASGVNTAMKAGNELGRIVGSLKKAGVQNVDATIIPIKNSGDQASVQIAYARSEAIAPKDCDMMPGTYGGSDPTAVADYRFGCSVETIMAKQIARPSDLQGREGYAGLKDGMRNTNVIWPYKSGEILGELGGETTE